MKPHPLADRLPRTSPEAHDYPRWDALPLMRNAAPKGVYVSGGSGVAIGASKIVITAGEESTLQVGGGAPRGTRVYYARRRPSDRTRPAGRARARFRAATSLGG